MTDRVAIKVDNYTVNAGVWTTVYDPPQAPLEVPITIVNQGGDVVELYTSRSNALIQLPAGKTFEANPSDVIKARAQTTTAYVQAIFNGRFGEVGATTSGGLSAADLEALANARTQKQLLAEILLELRIVNAYNKAAHDEEFTARDIAAGDLRTINQRHF
jgi:hypothetical protein